MTKSINIFKENSEAILNAWMLDRQIPGDLGLFQEEDLADSRAFFDSCIKFLSDQSAFPAEQRSYGDALKIIHRICSRGDRIAHSSRYTKHYTSGLRESLFAKLNEQMTEPYELLKETSAITRLFDDLNALAFENFLAEKEELIRHNRKLTSNERFPVLKIWDGVLAVPIIGELHVERAEQMVEDVLGHLAKQTSFTIVILDVSGVTDVNADVAGYLEKAASAIKLMGGKCIISGIQPKVAMSIILEGIDLSNLVIKTRLSNAVKTSFEMLGLQVVK